MLQGEGGGGVVEIAGASTENINPSIWKVMAAFEISPLTSILSPGRGACARGVRVGWGRAPCAAPRLCAPAVPPSRGSGAGAAAAPRRWSRAPTSLRLEPTAARGRCEVGLYSFFFACFGVFGVCFVFVCLFYFFFF